MKTLGSQHTRRRQKGFWVSCGLGVLLLALSCLAVAHQSASPSPYDVALLIQGAHSAPPNKVIAYHNEKFSFLETWDGIDVRLWRRTDASEPWRMFRHWKNLIAGWESSPKNEMTYLLANLGGMFEIYDAHNYEMLYRTSANLAPKPAAPAVYVVPVDNGRVIILELEELDPQGQKFSSLHLAAPGKGFVPWQPFPRNPRITTFFELGDGLFAAQTEDERWQLIRVDNPGEIHTVSLPELPPAPLDEVRRLQHGVFAVALQGATLRTREDIDNTWSLFHVNQRGEVLPIRVPGLKPDAIKEVRAFSGGFIELVERANELTRFYRMDEDKRLVLAHQAIPGLPDAIRIFRVLAEGKVVGAKEFDDADADDIPGDWTWRLQDFRGDWRPPHDLLPGLEGDIATMVDWLEGEGLGVQTVLPDNNSFWHWYLREGRTGRWQPIRQALPFPRPMQIAAIRDRRDGLIELVVAQDEQPPVETNSPVSDEVRNIHWMMRTEDGEWSAVRNLVANHAPGLEKRIVAVDARNNSLMVDVLHNADEPSSRLLFYKNRERQWEKLDNTFYAAVGRTAQDARAVRLFPKVQDAEVVADGRLVLLREQGDANWDGQAEDTQFLQLGTHSAQDGLSGKATRLRYEADSGLLIRTDRVTGEKHFFYYLEDAGTWTDIRSIIPDPPAKIEDAYVFADGRGIRVRDSKGTSPIHFVDRQAAENDDEHSIYYPNYLNDWRVYYRDGELWQDIRKSLPDPFPAIQYADSSLGGPAISVEETGDADGNGLAEERRHYYRSGATWVALDRQWPASEFPLSPFNTKISADGRLITIRKLGNINENDILSDLIVGVWSDVRQGFVPIDTIIDRPAGPIFKALSLWNGKGLAICIPKLPPMSPEALASVMSRGRNLLCDGGNPFDDLEEQWHFYEYRAADRWQAIQASVSDVAEIRSDASGRFLAFQSGFTFLLEDWELWTRKTAGSEFVRWQGDQIDDSLEVTDIRLDITDGLAALKTRDLKRDGGERWELWRQEGNGLSFIGHSATPTWLGLNHHAVSQTQVHFDNASHYLDGRQVDSVPKPAIWFHGMPELPKSQENAVYAPNILTQALAIPDGISPPVRVKALGYGPDGTVVVYRSGDRLLVAGFSNGPVWIETRSLSNQDTDTRRTASLTLLVNQLPDGTERQARLDAPDRWLWSYRHQNGHIYYDNRGYFFNETDAVSELLTFRVGLEVHSFAQLDSYLFRPDLLEKRLGLPERSLFRLSWRDVERNELARNLAPEGVEVASLQPPRVEAANYATVVDVPFVELTLEAEGFGIDESSILLHVLGAGQVRSPLRRASGTKRRRLSIVKQVDLMPGENHLKITVFDANGLSHSQHLVVTFKPEVERKPTLYAAVVATAQYTAAKSLDNLPLTQNDARSIIAAFNKQNGKRFDKVKIHTWCQEEGCLSRPTRRNLVDELPTFLSGAQDGDYIVVYISGHGLKIDRNYFMVPEDGNPDLPATLLAWSQIRDWLRDTRLGRKIVLLDSCHSGAAFQHHLVQEAAERDGLYMLSATAADAAAYELDRLGNGVFTYVVQEGLEGKADRDSNSVVSFEELARYIGDNVRDLSSRHDIRMEPYVPILSQYLDFPLSDVKNLRRVFLQVTDSSSFGYQALPDRFAWWQKRIGEMDELSLSDLQNELYRLSIVEDAGEPSHSLLSTSDGTEISRWDFSEISVGDMLQALVEKLSSHHQATAVCGSKGLTPNLECR